MTVDYRELKKEPSSVHVAVPNTGPILDNVAIVLEIYATLDLANVFFSIPLTGGSQNQYVFTWEGQQWAFQSASSRLST